MLACLGRPQDWFGMPARAILDDDVLRFHWACAAAQEFLKPPKAQR